jgi:hypothetical protein
MNVLHLTPNWDFDPLLEAQQGKIRPTPAARVSLPPARIVDVQLLNRGVVTGLAAEATKVVRRFQGTRTTAEHYGAVEITRVADSYLASNLPRVSRTGVLAPYRAWFRAQEESAQASMTASYPGQLDVYA